VKSKRLLKKKLTKRRNLERSTKREFSDLNNESLEGEN